MRRGKVANPAKVRNSKIYPLLGIYAPFLLERFLKINLALGDRLCEASGAGTNSPLMRLPAPKRMKDITLVGKAVAAAIFQSRKFREEEQKAALAIIGKASKPEDIVDNMSAIGNVSAVRQKLEKAGAVKANDTELDAFQRQVLASLADLDKASKTPAASAPKA